MSYLVGNEQFARPPNPKPQNSSQSSSQNYSSSNFTKERNQSKEKSGKKNSLKVKFSDDERSSPTQTPKPEPNIKINSKDIVTDSIQIQYEIKMAEAFVEPNPKPLIKFPGPPTGTNTLTFEKTLGLIDSTNRNSKECNSGNQTDQNTKEKIDESKILQSNDNNNQSNMIDCSLDVTKPSVLNDSLY